MAYRSLRVLLVNTRHFRGGGDSIYAFNLADLLRAHGHEVGFFAMQDPRNMPDPNADLFVSHIDFRELIGQKSPRTGLMVLGRSIYSREARSKFRKLLDRINPDIVHLQNIHAHITPSVVFEAKRRGLPVVWTLHDYKLVCPNSHFLIDRTGETCEACGTASYYQCALKRCKKGSLLASSMAATEAYAHRLIRVRDHVDAFLTPSRFLRHKLVQHGFSAETVHHLPLFVPYAQFQSSSREDGTYILYLGKLDPIKGIMPLLEACRLAQDVKIVMAGAVEEPLRSRLSQMSPQNLAYVGIVQGETLNELLAGCLAMVLPSLSYENQPLAVLEAFAAGKPVVGSNLGGIRELVGDQERGLLVEPGSAADLAWALRWVTAHPREARAMGQAARDYVVTEHSPEKHLGRLMRVYEEAAADTMLVPVSTENLPVASVPPGIELK